MFLKKLEDLLKNAIAMKLWDGEDGAASGDVAVDDVPADDDMGGEPKPSEGDNSEIKDLKGDIDIPDDDFEAILNSDPEYREMLEKGKKESEPPSDDDSGEGKDDDTTTAGKDGSALPDSSEDDVEFEDNVIPGISGEAFGKLDKVVQSALGEHYQKAQETAEKLTSTEERLNRLLEDPVVAMQNDLIAKGRGGTYQNLRGITPQEAKEIQNKLGLDDDDIKLLIPMLDPIVKDRAQVMINNYAVEKNNQTVIADLQQKGKELLLGLSEFNKELALKETNIDKILEQKEKHPEWEAFKNGIGKIRQWCIDRGYKYHDIAKMFSPKALYAAAAADVGLPVAINLDKRDQTLIAETRKKALSPFFKNKSSKTLQPGSSPENRRELQHKVQKGGYDIIRLVTDEAYYERAVNKDYGNVDHLEKIDALAAEGRALLKKQKQKK